MFTWRGIVLLDQNFLRQKRRYAAQAVLAALTLGVVLAIVETLANVAIITAIASSAVIVFMTPHSTMARPRRVIGGHFVGATNWASCGRNSRYCWGFLRNGNRNGYLCRHGGWNQHASYGRD